MSWHACLQLPAFGRMSVSITNIHEGFDCKTSEGGNIRHWKFMFSGYLTGVCTETPYLIGMEAPVLRLRGIDVPTYLGTVATVPRHYLKRDSKSYTTPTESFSTASLCISISNTHVFVRGLQSVNSSPNLRSGL